MNLNQVTLAGNLTRDPELRYTPKGTAVGKLGLAINRTYSTPDGERKEETTFVDVDVFGKTAENVAQYLKKGSTILLTGRLKFDKWDDKQTGQKRNKLCVAADFVQFGSKPAAPSASQPAPARPAPSAASNTPPTEGDDVPF